MSNQEQTDVAPEGLLNAVSGLVAHVYTKTTSVATGAASTAVRAAAPYATATTLVLLQRAEVQHLLGKAKSLTQHYAPIYNKHLVVPVRTRKFLHEPDAPTRLFEDSAAGKLAVAASCEKQLAALQALVIQLEEELILVVSPPEPPELRDERRVQAWTVFKWLGLWQPKPDFRDGQDAQVYASKHPYLPEAAYTEADRTNLYGLTVEEREDFWQRFLAQGNNMQHPEWRQSFELLREDIMAMRPRCHQLRVKIADVRKKISMYKRVLGLTGHSVSSAAAAPSADANVQAPDRDNDVRLHAT